MAIDAKKAAELINNGKFDNADELYDALNGHKEYAKEFALLLKHIENKVKLDISLYAGLATSAMSVAKLSENVNPMDAKDPAFADARKKLANIELYQVVEENGKTVNKVVQGKERAQMIAQIVAAAKLEADSELRGASSPESPDAKKFMTAADDAARKAIYQNTLNEKIDLAILQSFLVTESEKINKEMSQKYAGDEKKAVAEAKKLIATRTAELKTEVANLAKSTSKKISMNVNGAVAYCANVAVKVEGQLTEYKTNIRKIANRINQGFAKLKDQGKTLRNQWKEARAGANKVFESCSQKMAENIAIFNDRCKRVWNVTYEVAKNVAKSIADRKYELGADMLAAAGFAATVTTGGTAALVGGAVYAAYTIGRRVIYEAYKQKKAHPEKSYKQIYTNGKFITKSVFSCAAAALSWGIASTAASAGADIATQTVTEITKQIASQKMTRRFVTMAGSVTSNIVGVATAEDAKERKKELKGLGISALTSAASIFLTELFDKESNTDIKTDTVENTETGATEAGNAETGAAKAGAAEAGNAETGAAEAGATEAGNAETGAVEEADELIMREFPDQWNENMGISKNQFDTLKNWYEELDTNEGLGMDRFYSHAAYYADELSVDPENPMTPEQVLFKFSHLAAITSVRNGEYGTIGTGSLGRQLDDLYHLLGCGTLKSEDNWEEYRKTLDICTLNEADRVDGRMDAEKFFAVAGAGYKGLPVDDDGTLTMTRNIRVIGEGTNCPGDKRVMYEEVKTKEEVIEEKVVETPVRPRIEPLEAPKTRIVTEAKSGIDMKLTIPERQETEDDDMIVGAVSQTGDRPGIEGATAAKSLSKDSEYTNMNRRQQRLAEQMMKEIKGKGIEK